MRGESVGGVVRVREGREGEEGVGEREKGTLQREGLWMLPSPLRHTKVPLMTLCDSPLPFIPLKPRGRNGVIREHTGSIGGASHGSSVSGQTVSSTSTSNFLPPFPLTDLRSTSRSTRRSFLFTSSIYLFSNPPCPRPHSASRISSPSQARWTVSISM